MCFFSLDEDEEEDEVEDEDVQLDLVQVLLISGHLVYRPSLQRNLRLSPPQLEDEEEDEDEDELQSSVQSGNFMLRANCRFGGVM